VKDSRIALRQVEDADLTEKERRHGPGYTWVDVMQTAPSKRHLCRIGMKAHFNAVQVHLEVSCFGPESARLTRKAIDALREVFAHDSPYGQEFIVAMFDVDPGERHAKFMELMGLNPCSRLYISTTPVAPVTE